ncbi:MAG: hypothetical protein AAF399_14330, partial [Bacteroidota bacterium]
MMVKLLHIICLSGVLLAIPATLPAQVDPGKIAAKQGGRLINRMMRRGQRWVKRSIRELRKGSETPIDEQTVRSNLWVIGTEPTWLLEEGGNRTYPYNLLTHLVVGEYDVHPLTANPRDQEAASGWLVNSSIYDTARSRNEELNILINVSCYGDFGPPAQRSGFYLDFLSSKRMHNQLIESLRSYYWAESGPIIDGLVIDFQQIPPQNGKEFMNLLREMKEGLGIPLWLRLPSIREGVHVYQEDLLEKISETEEGLLEGFLLKGYGYHQLNALSSTSLIGESEGEGIAAAIAYFEHGGKGIPREKMVIDLANIGVAWNRKGNDYVP